MCDGALPCERSDVDRTVSGAEPIEPRQPVHVDEHIGASQPEVHHRHQALAPAQDLRTLAVLIQESQRIVDGFGPGVGEAGRLQVSPRTSDAASTEYT